MTLTASAGRMREPETAVPCELSSAVEEDLRIFRDESSTVEERDAALHRLADPSLSVGERCEVLDRLSGDWDDEHEAAMNTALSEVMDAEWGVIPSGETRNVSDEEILWILKNVPERLWAGFQQPPAPKLEGLPLLPAIRPAGRARTPRRTRRARTTKQARAPDPEPEPPDVGLRPAWGRSWLRRVW